VPPVSPSSPPAGWWIVEAADVPEEPDFELVHLLGVTGAAWRFVPEAASSRDGVTPPAGERLGRLQAVRPGYVVDSVALSLVADGPGGWVFRSPVSPEATFECRLELAGGGDCHLALRCAGGRARVTLRGAVPEEVASAEDALGRHPSVEDACAKAEACWSEARRAFPYLADYAPPARPDLRRCEASVVILSRQYAAMRRPPPPACHLAPNPGALPGSNGP
jgi:hypothetical protein